MTDRRTNSRALSPAAREALREGVAWSFTVLAELANKLMAAWMHGTPSEIDERGRGFWRLKLTPMGLQWQGDLRELERMREIASAAAGQQAQLEGVA